MLKEVVGLLIKVPQKNINKMVRARNTNFSTDAQHYGKLGSPSAYVPGGGVSMIGRAIPAAGNTFLTPYMEIKCPRPRKIKKLIILI